MNNLKLFRKDVYEPIGRILDSVGDAGFITEGPLVIEDFYKRHREILESFGTKPAIRGYTRKKIICENGRHAARCMEWAPDAVSSIHEHGGRPCFDIVLEGRLKIVDYFPERIEGNLFELREVNKYEVGPGEMVLVNPIKDKSEVHMVMNSGVRSRSIHFYPIDHRFLGVYETVGEDKYRKSKRAVSDD